MNNCTGKFKYNGNDILCERKWRCKLYPVKVKNAKTPKSKTNPCEHFKAAFANLQTT